MRESAFRRLDFAFISYRPAKPTSHFEHDGDGALKGIGEASITRKSEGDPLALPEVIIDMVRDL